MTAQEVFDTVSKHLLSMPHRAIKSIPTGADGQRASCAYRSYDGTPCAVGVLLTDEEIQLRDGSGTVDDLPATGVEALDIAGYLPERLVPHLDLLMSLQIVHDNVTNWTSPTGPADQPRMRQDLARVAKLFELR